MNQQLLPTFNPSDNELVEMALAMPYEKKVARAIDLLKFWEPKAISASPEIGFHGGFSGGKDSVVIYWLSKAAGIKAGWFYNDTTIDPPEIHALINDFYPDVVWNTPADKHGHLIKDRMIEKRSMPTRIGKWCCSEYKDCCTQQNSISIVGVRIAESARRAGLWSEAHKHTKTGRTIIAPIAYWTDEDVWRFIKENDLPYCELYDQGWTRLGCVGCPINPASQKKEFERWPEYEKMWKDAAYKIWEISQTEKNTRGEWRYWKKFETPEAMWQWWLIGGHATEEPNCVFEEMMENT